MTFTGRTDIWKAVIHMCPNLAVGAGFESFWNTYGHNLHGLSLYQKEINSSHNGYIEVYLNLGLIGVSLIVWILIGGYRGAIAAFGRNQEIGCLMLAYIATAALYSVTEAGFRILTPTWISLLLAIVASSSTAPGLIGSKVSQLRASRVRRGVFDRSPTNPTHYPLGSDS
jgi:exopolysaccharide production protein ExoQ